MSFGVKQETCLDFPLEDQSKSTSMLVRSQRTTILASNDIQADYFCFVGLQKLVWQYVVLWLDELAVLNIKAEVKAISGNTWPIPIEVKHFETKLIFSGKCNFFD